MAIILEVGRYFHVQYFDPILRKTVRKSTKLLITKANRVIVKKICNKLQDELTRKSQERSGFNIREVSIGEAIAHFNKVMSDSHPKTKRDIDRFLKMFLRYFNREDPCLSISKLSVEDFLLDIRKLDLKQNSIHAYGKRLNHFLNFLFEYEYVPMFKVNKNVKTRPEVVEKITIQEEDFEQIFRYLYNKTSNFKTAICLLFMTGLRSSDVMEIKCEYINFERMTMRYYSPKRKKYREVAFHPDLKGLLLERVKEIQSGKLIQYNSVENLGKAVTRYFSEIQIGRRGYTARSFRKTFITISLNKFKMDHTVVKELVGHEHTNTTDKYYNRISFDVQHEELKKFQIPILEWIAEGPDNLTPW